MLRPPNLLLLLFEYYSPFPRPALLWVPVPRAKIAANALPRENRGFCLGGGLPACVVGVGAQLGAPLLFLGAMLPIGGAFPGGAAAGRGRGGSRHRCTA